MKKVVWLCVVLCFFESCQSWFSNEGNNIVLEVESRGETFDKTPIADWPTIGSIVSMESVNDKLYLTMAMGNQPKLPKDSKYVLQRLDSLGELHILHMEIGAAKEHYQPGDTVSCAFSIEVYDGFNRKIDELPKVLDSILSK